jgi:AraC-like DNA-binding protein
MTIVNPFELSCLQGDNVIWGDTYFSPKNGILLPEAKKFAAKGGWGNMFFQAVLKEKFSIWLSNYDITERKDFLARENVSLLEFSLQMDSEVVYQARPFNHQTVRTNQFNIFYLPYMESRASFESGQHITTLDIHCTNEFLLSIAQHFPDIMYPFLEKVDNEKSARIFNAPLYATNYMLTIAENILRLLQADRISDYLLELGVTELISYALTCKYELDPKRKRISLEDISRIHAIRNFLLSDFSAKPNLSELAVQYHMSVPKLKDTFKKIMEIAPYNFWMIHRLKRGRKLVCTTSTSITDISYDLGFSSLSAFSKAFKNYFEISPADLRDQTLESEMQNIRIDNSKKK